MVCPWYTESVNWSVNWAHLGADSKRQQDERAAEEDDGALQPPDSPQHFRTLRKRRHDESDEDGGQEATAHTVKALLSCSLPPLLHICGEFHRQNKY